LQQRRLNRKVVQIIFSKWSKVGSTIHKYTTKTLKLAEYLQLLADSGAKRESKQCGKQRLNDFYQCVPIAKPSFARSLATMITSERNYCQRWRRQQSAQKGGCMQISRAKLRVFCRHEWTRGPRAAPRASNADPNQPSAYYGCCA
jgi:hypothetical protein